MIGQKNINYSYFQFQSCLFTMTNIAKNSYKSQSVYSGYGLAFYGAGLCSFGYDFARNVVIFGVDNSS